MQYFRFVGIINISHLLKEIINPSIKLVRLSFLMTSTFFTTDYIRVYKLQSRNKHTILFVFLLSVSKVISQDTNAVISNVFTKGLFMSKAK
jgi:transcriptional regulator CtsR